MRFLKDASKRHRTPSTDYSRTTSASLRGHSQKLSLGGRNNEEKNLWVSQEAYNVTLEFIEKNKGNLNESNMDKLLHGLNMIWGKREQETIEKISSQFRSEIATLKRKLSQVSIGGIEGNQANLKQRKNSRDVEKENESPSIRQSHKYFYSLVILFSVFE